MKPKKHHPQLRHSLVALGLVTAAISPAAHAANFTWDITGGDGAAITPGSGAWNATATNWNNGSTNVPWAAANVAIFGGADGTYAVDLGAALSVQALTYNNSGYTIGATTPNTLTVTNNSDMFTIAANVSTAIGTGATFNFNTTSGNSNRIIFNNGSALTVASGATLTKTGATNGGLVLRTASGNSGTLNINGSVLIANNTGGAFNISNPAAAPGGTITVNVNDGGILSTNSAGTANTNQGAILVGNGGTGILNVGGGTTGGSVVATNTAVTAALTLGVTNSADSNGTVNLNGGSISVPRVRKHSAGATGIFNFNGGTLKPTLSDTGFMTGLTRANVRDGGAKIDTNGFDITIAQNLVHSDIVDDAAVDGGLTKTGAGTLTLSGADDYTGTTTVNGGTLALDFLGLLSSNIVVNSGGNLSGNGITSGTLTLNSGATFTALTDGTAITASGGVNIAGTAKLAFSGAVGNGSTYDLFFYGAGGVTGLANLSAPFRVVLANDAGAGKVTGTVSTGTRTWNTNSGTWEINGAANFLEGDKKFFNGDSVIFNNRPSASTITINGNPQPSDISLTNTSSAYTFSGTGSIGGVGGLTKAGSGTLNIANSNNYSGATLVNAGTLQLDGGLSGSAISVAAGASLSESATGVIGGASSLSVAGTATLTGINTYTGTTEIIAGGTLTLGDGTSDGTIASASVTNNGSMSFNTSGTVTYANAITGTGSVTKLGFGTLSLSNATAGHSGGTFLNEGTLLGGAILNGGPVTIAAGTTLTFTANNVNMSCPVSGPGAIVNNSANTILITGDHSGFTGSFTHSAGGNNTQFNEPLSTSANASYTITGGEMIFSKAGDYTVKMGSLSSTGGTIRGANSGTSTGVTTLEVGNLNTDTVINGGLQNGSTKILALTKVGTGRLTLAGNKGYTGLTNINAGVLQVNNTLASPGVNVNGGAIAGAGSLTGSLVVNTGGAVNPGAPTGTLTVNSTTEIHGKYVCEIDGAASDRIIVNGPLSLDGSSVLDFDIVNAPAAQVYVIANYTTLSGTFGSVVDLPAGYTVNYAYNDGVSSNHIAIVSAATPYGTWINSYFPGVTDPAIIGSTADPDNDGESNGLEFALGGVPNSGSDRSKVYPLLADSDADVDATRELVLTIAVRSGTPAFTGSPSPSATQEGYTYTIQGSTTLGSFTTAAVPVTPVLTGLPAAPAGYEYRSFSLSGSNGMPNKGFLRVTVTP